MILFKICTTYIRKINVIFLIMTYKATWMRIIYLFVIGNYYFNYYFKNLLINFVRQLIYLLGITGI